MVVADENVTIGAGKLERVKVKEIMSRKTCLRYHAHSATTACFGVKVATKEGPSLWKWTVPSTWLMS